MSEAKDDSAQKPKAVTMTFAEITALCNRLMARAQSFCRTGASGRYRASRRWIRALLRNVNHTDVVVIENSA
jgi:hypothetical protein